LHKKILTTFKGSNISRNGIQARCNRLRQEYALRPFVICAPTDAVFSANTGDQHTEFIFIENVDDLVKTEPALFYARAVLKMTIKSQLFP